MDILLATVGAEAPLTIFLLFTKGLALGCALGFAPGSLTTLVISEGMVHGRRAGIVASLAPLITDAPIIIVALAVLSQFSGKDCVLRVISFTGAVLLIWIGYKCMIVKADAFETKGEKSSSLFKAIGVNFLNPNPYIFWTTVNGSIVLRAWNVSVFAPAAFMIPFYIALISSKMTMGIAASSVSHRVDTGKLVWVNRILGIVMYIMAYWLAYSAYTGNFGEH